jgi:hypothetical protein
MGILSTRMTAAFILALFVAGCGGGAEGEGPDNNRILNSSVSSVNANSSSSAENSSVASSVTGSSDSSTSSSSSSSSNSSSSINSVSSSSGSSSSSANVSSSSSTSVIGGSLLPGAFTLSQTKLAFSAKRFGQVPATGTVAISLTGPDTAAVGVAFRNGAVQPSWLTVRIVGAAPNYSVLILINSTALPIGTQSSVVSIGTSDASGKILQYQDIELNYTVKNGVVIQSSPISVNAVFGHSTTAFSKSFLVQADSVRWAAKSDSPWVQVSANTLTGSMGMQFAIDTSNLSLGSSLATITVTNIDDPSDFSTISVSASLAAPTLVVSGSTLSFGGLSGLEMGAKPLDFSLSTGTNQYPWSLSFTPDNGMSWLAVGTTSGTVGDSKYSVLLTPNAKHLSMGTYGGQLRLSANVKGVQISSVILAGLTVDAQRIWVEAAGVGLSQFPSRQVLTRHVRVFNSLERSDVTWQASSNQSWLTVSPSGLGSNPIVLTADPTGLTPNQTYFADVAVTSSDPLITNQDSIRVGLWVGSSNPVDTLLPITATYLATSPVEPLVYVNDGATTITVYDVNSASLLSTFSGIGTKLGPMTLSQDGKQLFVADGPANNVLVIDLQSNKLLRVLSLTPLDPNIAPNFLLGLAYARPEGHPILAVPSRGEIFDGMTGQKFSVGLRGFGMITVSKDGHRIYMQSNLNSPTDIVMDEFRYSSVAVERLVATGHVVMSGHDDPYFPSNGRDIALNSDDSILIRASGSPYGFELANPLSLLGYDLKLAAPYPSSVECGWAGKCYGGITLAPTAQNIFVYDNAMNYLGSLSSGTLEMDSPQMALSADNTRIVLSAQDCCTVNRLRFITVLP